MSAPIPFPSPASTGQGNGTTRVSISGDLIEQLGVEELVTYLRLKLWYLRGEESSLRRLADEQAWLGGRSRAASWVSSLQDRGLVISLNDYAAIQEAEEAEEAKMSRAASRARAAEVVEWLDGRWFGPWPVDRAQALPVDGVPVVYYAYLEGASRPVYVGSTGSFLKRMGQQVEHRRSDGWARWETRECSSRRAAYVLESQEIDRLQPALNRTTGADYLRQAAR